MVTINVTFLLVILTTVLISFNFSPTANAHLKTWNTPPNGNVIQPLTGTDAKNKDDILMPKQHRTKPQKGEEAAAAGDSKTSGTDLEPNQDDEVATEMMQTQSGNGGNENGNPKAKAEKLIANRPDKEESDSVLKNEPGIVESDPIQNVNILAEPFASSPVLSEDNETSAMNTAEVSKDVPLIIVYEDSGVVLEDSARAMNMNSESNLMSKPEKSIIITEEEAVSETNPESQKMMDKLRRVGEDTALLHNLTSEMNTLTPQGVETKESVVEPYDSNSFANEEPFSVGNNGVGREPLSDNDGRQVIQNNVTQNTPVREWRNYDWEKNEQSIAVPILTIIEGFSKQLRPHNSDEETDTADNTGSESDNFWSPYNRNDPEDDDGSPKNTFSVSLYSRDAHEDNPQASLYKLNNGMDTRYFAHGHDPSYYVGNPAGSAYMRLRREDTSQLCVVPCSPVNYIVQPYHYGYYDAASDHSYATGVQLPHLHLPQLQLPPVKFPDLHDISSPHPSVSFDGHGSHGSSSENAQGHNYVVTSNAHAGASQGGHHYGGVSYSHVKDPSSHMAYSLDTPLKYVQTSMVLKPPHPYKKIFPSMNNV